MAISMQKMEKFKPHIAQVAVQVAYAGMNIITRVALVDGMNSFVFVTYRQIVATLVIAPLAYVLERYEKVEIRKMRGKAKVVGTTICVGGAMVITLYKGPVIKLLTAYNSTANYNNILGSKRVLGCILLFASVFTWSSWITFQVPVAKKYPAELSLTALMCMLGAVQSGVLAFICEYKTPSVWSISWNIELLSYVYTGVLCSAFGFFVQTWCVHIKGPVFAAIFNPLNTILVSLLECLVFHDNLHVGSVVGAILIVGGLYSVLWGKANDHETEQRGESGAEYSNNINGVRDVDDQQTAIDIKRPLLQSRSHN